MKGKITISKDEVKKMATKWVTENALQPTGFRITEVKTAFYGSYEPMEVEFTNEPEEGLPEGGE